MHKIFRSVVTFYHDGWIFYRSSLRKYTVRSWIDILRWPHSRSDQSTSITDYNTYLDMLFSILSSRWFIDIQYNDKLQHLWLLSTSRSTIGVPSIYKFIVILDFGPTKPNNQSVGHLCRHNHVLLLIYLYADNRFH